MFATIEVLNHFFSLDFAWIINFIMANILWLFLFAAAAAFLYDKKNWFWSLVYVTFYVWAISEFGVLVGWQVLSKEFLSVTLIAAVAVLTFAEFDSWGSKHLLLVNTLRFLAVLIIFNLFMV